MAKDTTKYKFNGQTNLAKNKLVLEVVKKYVKDNKNITYKELQAKFPDKLQGAIGVLKSEEDLIKWEEGKKETNKRDRRFHSNEPILLNNNLKIFVCTEWGAKSYDKKTENYKEGNIERFLIFARNELKYDIQEVNSNYNKGSKVKQENKESNNMTKIKNIILYGAPGVGKTYNYKKLIPLIESGKYNESNIFNSIIENQKLYDIDIGKIFETIKNEKRVEFVTFHQSYSYEDFIEGFRPQEDGNIKLEDGIFKKLCKTAFQEKQKNFYIVIDEINRGNISKIFGELITLIEEDKRDDYEVTLPYSKDKFKIPSNLYIIATMNSTDKSIATIDIALRRRFTFLKMKPNLNLVKYENAQKLMEKLNKHISNAISEDYALGHSYFMNIKNDDDLKFIKEYKIKPLLEEYFYGDEINYKIAEDILYGRVDK